ncbi:unnamed protein product, partial [Mycena citricolor]
TDPVLEHPPFTAAPPIPVQGSPYTDETRGVGTARRRPGAHGRGDIRGNGGGPQVHADPDEPPRSDTADCTTGYRMLQRDAATPPPPSALAYGSRLGGGARGARRTRRALIPRGS